MATKQQARNALKAQHRAAVLCDESDGEMYRVYLEAGEGWNWSGNYHAASITWYADDNKADFWDRVIEEIRDLEDAVPCDAYTCECWYDEAEMCGYYGHEGAENV